MLEPFAMSFIAPLNHILGQAPWARERLTPFAGKTVQFLAFPFDYRVTVTADGLGQPAGSAQSVDVTIAVTPATAMRFFRGDAAAQTEAKIDGDMAFAQEIAYLARHLRWDYEEDLSKVFGDVAAHRAGEAVRGMSSWLTEAGNNLAESLRDYWVQERPMLAAPEAVEQFNRDVDQLRDDVERLEKRLDKSSLR